jgi:hypothetical protein
VAANARKIGTEALERFLWSINDGLFGKSKMWCQFICYISLYGVIIVLWSNLRPLLREFEAENIKQPQFQKNSNSSLYY